MALEMPSTRSKRNCPGEMGIGEDWTDMGTEGVRGRENKHVPVVTQVAKVSLALEGRLLKEGVLYLRGTSGPQIPWDMHGGEWENPYSPGPSFPKLCYIPQGQGPIPSSRRPSFPS